MCIRDRLCAALLEREFDAKTIRVLIMDTGFKNLYHPSVSLVLNCPAEMEYENSKGKTEKERLEAGTGLTIQPGDDRLKYGRIILNPDNPDGVTITSIERSQGTPVYTGKMEIKACDEGLVLVCLLYTS